MSACLAIAAHDPLGAFASADPAMLASRALLRRCDTKFVLPASALPAILDAIASDYAVVRMPVERAQYRSLYFDTPELRCFHDHRRGRRLRHKIRIRQYPDRGAAFLEVKARRSELETDKQRLAVGEHQVRLGAAELAFLHAHVPYADALRPQLWIDYRRITLLGLAVDERVTIDVDLATARLDGARIALSSFAVVEVKQAEPTPSPITRALAAAHVRPGSSSKYIVSLAALRPQVRMNRFLPTLRALERTS